MKHDVTSMCVCQQLSCVQLCATPWTVAHQTPLSMEFSRQEYCSGLPFSSPGDLPNPGIKPGIPQFLLLDQESGDEESGEIQELFPCSSPALCPQYSSGRPFSGSLAVYAEKAMAPHSSTLAWKIHGQRSLVGCSPWGCCGSDTTERLHFHFSLSCIGEGNGNPLQCSCLENPRDGEAWWAAVSGVAQSWTRLK